MHSCFIITLVYPQKQIQGGVFVGGINYEGDLAPSSFIVSLSETHLDLGVFLNVKTNDWFAFNINYHHGSLSGTDANAKDLGRVNRNLRFWSPLDEFSISSAFFYVSKHQKRYIIGSVGIVFNILGKNSRDNFFKNKNNYLNCKQLFKRSK